MGEMGHRSQMLGQRGIGKLQELNVDLSRTESFSYFEGGRQALLFMMFIPLYHRHKAYESYSPKYVRIHLGQRKGFEMLFLWTERRVRVSQTDCMGFCEFFNILVPFFRSLTRK